MSIQLATQDLVDRVKAVSSLGGRVGLAVGGQEIDPINRDLALPGAWVVYVGDTLVDASEMNPHFEFIKADFVVKVLVDYDNEANLISTHLPLLHEVVQSIRGNNPTLLPGSKWLYEGMGLESLEPSRMVWVQNYSIKFGI